MPVFSHTISSARSVHLKPIHRCGRTQNAEDRAITHDARNRAETQDTRDHTLVPRDHTLVQGNEDRTSTQHAEEVPAGPDSAEHPTPTHREKMPPGVDSTRDQRLVQGIEDRASAQHAEEMAPGAGLAVLLGRLAGNTADLALLKDDELISVLIGWRRLSSWAQAAELEAVSELESRRQARHTRDGVICSSEVTAGVGSEISLALTLTEHSASVLQSLAYSLTHHLPDTAALLKSGAIDLPRARVIVTGLTGISLPAMRKVEAAVLPHAPTMTTGRLRAFVAAKLAELAPEELITKTKAAQKDRRIEVREDGQGTATLLGLNLPLIATIAATNRITAIAKAFKNNGDPRTMDQLRADVLLMTMLGHIPARTTPSTTAPNPTTPNPTDPSPTTPSPTAPEPPPPHPTMSATKPEHAANHPSDATHATDIPPTGRATPAEPWPQAPSPEHPPDAAYADTTTEVPDGDHGLPDDLGGDESWDEEEGAGVPEWLTRAATEQLGGPHLVVSLATLVKLTQTPARLGPYAPLVAEIARQIFDKQLATGVKVCWTVTGSDGAALHHGQMRYRPSEAMRRLVQARDQTCRFPTCRRPATACDLDHTRPYDEGGPTCPCNLAPLCRRHHQLKQTEGWKLTHTKPGVLSWETPTRRTHTVSPDPYPI